MADVSTGEAIVSIIGLAIFARVAFWLIAESFR